MKIESLKGEIFIFLEKEEATGTLPSSEAFLPTARGQRGRCYCCHTHAYSFDCLIKTLCFLQITYVKMFQSALLPLDDWMMTEFEHYVVILSHLNQGNQKNCPCVKQMPTQCYKSKIIFTLESWLFQEHQFTFKCPCFHRDSFVSFALRMLSTLISVISIKFVGFQSS